MRMKSEWRGEGIRPNPGRRYMGYVMAVVSRECRTRVSTGDPRNPGRWRPWANPSARQWNSRGVRALSRWGLNLAEDVLSPSRRKSCGRE
jgi:hypothetical protein